MPGTVTTPFPSAITAAVHRFRPARRHYERLPALPDGVLVTGDAVASFPPVYAQGITVAALDALALREALAGGSADHDLRAGSVQPSGGTLADPTMLR